MAVYSLAALKGGGRDESMGQNQGVGRAALLPEARVGNPCPTIPSGWLLLAPLGLWPCHLDLCLYGHIATSSSVCACVCGGGINVPQFLCYQDACDYSYVPQIILGDVPCLKTYNLIIFLKSFFCPIR